jgi:hypothetical protein
MIGECGVRVGVRVSVSVRLRLRIRLRLRLKMRVRVLTLRMLCPTASSLKNVVHLSTLERLPFMFFMTNCSAYST